MGDDQELMERIESINNSINILESVDTDGNEEAIRSLRRNIGEIVAELEVDYGGFLESSNPDFALKVLLEAKRIFGQAYAHDYAESCFFKSDNYGEEIISVYVANQSTISNFVYDAEYDIVTEKHLDSRELEDIVEVMMAVGIIRDGDSEEEGVEEE